MDTPLVIDNKAAIRLAAALAELTGESVTDSLVTALGERLARESLARERTASRSLARAIAANIGREGWLRDGVPNYGWCNAPAGIAR